MSASTRIVFWNIRAGGGKRAEAIGDQLLAWQPDVIGLSEFRGTPASQSLAERLSGAGWPHQIQTTDRTARARNALLLASRWPLRRRRIAGMPVLRDRWLLARIEAPRPFTMGLVHAPNFTSPDLKYPLLEAILDIAGRWRSGPSLIGGDTNSGLRHLDEETPLGPQFHREYDFIEGMGTRGWADAFRHLHGERREYTWYSHRNNGFRLDHVFLSPHLIPHLEACRHDWGRHPADPERREGLSDHAAVILDIATDPAARQPSPTPLRDGNQQDEDDAPDGHRFP